MAERSGDNRLYTFDVSASPHLCFVMVRGGLHSQFLFDALWAGQRPLPHPLSDTARGVTLSTAVVRGGPLELGYAYDARPSDRGERADIHPDRHTTFAAYLGEMQKAQGWIAKFRLLSVEIPRNRNWLGFGERFISHLERWLGQGRAHQELGRVIPSERRKWGIQA